jgi:hypothetical protein
VPATTRGPGPYRPRRPRSKPRQAKAGKSSIVFTRSVVTAITHGREKQRPAPALPSPADARPPSTAKGRKQKAKSGTYQGWVRRALTQPPPPIVGVSRNPSTEPVDRTRPTRGRQAREPAAAPRARRASDPPQAAREARPRPQPGTAQHRATAPHPQQPRTPARHRPRTGKTTPTTRRHPMASKTPATAPP